MAAVLSGIRQAPRAKCDPDRGDAGIKDLRAGHPNEVTDVHPVEQVDDAFGDGPVLRPRSVLVRDSSASLCCARNDNSVKPRRQLGLFDATMIVMGGIVGAAFFPILPRSRTAFILHF